jgi:hypothetical protein
MGSMMSQQGHNNYRKAHDPWSPQFRALVHATLCAWVCTPSQRTLLQLTQTDPLPQMPSHALQHNSATAAARLLF